MTATASRRATFKQSDATRALRAAQKAGMKPSGYKIDPSGAIIVMLHDGAPLRAVQTPPVSGKRAHKPDSGYSAFGRCCALR
jgi:hypothetical protein